jgi:hypothetical protein
VIGNRPPFAISTYSFRLRALVSHAGRAALGGDREVALACYATARLAAGMLSPFNLSPAEAAARASSTRNWLASIAVPPHARSALVVAIDAITSGDRKSASGALAEAATVCAPQLDPASEAELRELVTELLA